MSKTIKFSAGDVYINEQGRAETVEGIDKTPQDLAFNLMTEFIPSEDIGCKLAGEEPTMIGSLAGATAIISSMVSETVDRLIRHQNKISEKVTPDEKIYKIRQLVVKQYPTLSGTYAYLLSVVVDSGDETKVAMQVNLTHQDLQLT